MFLTALDVSLWTVINCYLISVVVFVFLRWMKFLREQ